jgi:uncharacterized membrane protein YfcA
MAQFIAEHALLFLAVLAAGLASGFAGGLFGIGGGVVTVPALYAVFRSFDIADGQSLKSAIGTSLAVIIVTSLRALATHHRGGHVDVAILKAWAPWIALGAAAGGAAARWVPAEHLAVVFAAGALYIGWRRLFAKQSVNGATPDLSRRGIHIPIGLGTGAFSALMGLGGGAVGVMVMTWSGRTIHQAVATASGFGVAVAVPGAAGFLFSGLGHEGLPPLSAGFVNLPAFAAMAAMSAIAAPYGARLAHRTKGDLLSKLFGLYVLAAAAGLIWDLFA